MAIELPKLVTDFTAFIDGVGASGIAKEATIPDVMLKTTEHIAAGMGGVADMSLGYLEKMESTLKMDGLSAKFAAQLGKRDAMLTLRGSLSDGFETQAAIFQMRGLFKKLGLGTLKRDDGGETEYMVNITYFKATIGGKEIVEVDIINKTWIVDGVDRFAEQREALGG